MAENTHLTGLKNKVAQEKKIAKELISSFQNLRTARNPADKRMMDSQINSLKDSLKKTNDEVLQNVERISIARPLGFGSTQKPPEKRKSLFSKKIFNQKESIKILPEKKLILNKSKISALEKEGLKRLKKKKEKIVTKKIRKPNEYVKLSNKMFGTFSSQLINKGTFAGLKKDLIKTNLQLTPLSYLSVILFTTFLSVFVGVLVFLFFLFFNLGAELPIITQATEDLGSRFLKVFWILLVVPLGTFWIMYLYPSLEKKSAEQKINQELPFVTIHMSAIAGSMVEPSKIFSIIIATKEYPYIRKEFIKLMNEINIYGYDLVTALRNCAANNPSKKLAELFNGLAITITSGGSLPAFFDKRAESLLFEHRLEREKYTKTAETFMDIYISVVIAAPMILMLLLMMMKISGLGLSLSTQMISLIMVMGVSIVNIVFLTLLHLKQPTE